MGSRADFIPNQWEDYKRYFDNKVDNIKLEDINISKFMIAQYFYLYINPYTLSVYNVCPTIMDMLNIKKDQIPKNVNDFIGFIHPDDYEFIDFAESWGFKKIIESKKINKFKIAYVMRFKVNEHDYEYFHHQTYYLVNPETNKIATCVAFNTRIGGLASEVERFERIVKLLSTDTLEVGNKATFYPSKNPLIDELTVREKEIIIYISKGFTGKEIADKLNVSYHTIRTHHSNINKKLNVKNPAELIKKCKEIGFLI